MSQNQEIDEPITMEFDFNLVLDVPEITGELESALFEAGCDDAVLTSSDGVVRLCFIREAQMLSDALISAWNDVRKAGVTVIRSDFCNLVNQSEIAARVGCSRQVINQYVHGKRGPKDFPPPVCFLHDEVPLWSWCEVSEWLYRHGVISDSQRQKAMALDVFNNLLDLCRNRKVSKDLYEKLAATIDLNNCGC